MKSHMNILTPITTFHTFIYAFIFDCAVCICACICECISSIASTMIYPRLNSSSMTLHCTYYHTFIKKNK